MRTSTTTASLCFPKQRYIHWLMASLCFGQPSLSLTLATTSKGGYHEIREIIGHLRQVWQYKTTCDTHPYNLATRVIYPCIVIGGSKTPTYVKESKEAMRLARSGRDSMTSVKIGTNGVKSRSSSKSPAYNKVSEETAGVTTKLGGLNWTEWDFARTNFLGLRFEFANSYHVGCGRHGGLTTSS